MSDNNEPMQIGTTSILRVNDMFTEVLGGMSSEEVNALTKMDLVIDPNDLMALGSDAIHAADALSAHQTGANPKKMKKQEKKSIYSPSKKPSVSSTCPRGQNTANVSATTCKRGTGIPKESTGVRSDDVHMSTKENNKPSSDQAKQRGSACAFSVGIVVSETQEEHGIDIQDHVEKEDDMTEENENNDALSDYALNSDDESEDEVYEQLLAAARKVNNKYRNGMLAERDVLVERYGYSSSALNGVDLPTGSALTTKGTSNIRFCFQELVRCALGPASHRTNSTPEGILKALAAVKSVDISDRNVMDTDDIICLDAVTHLYLQHNKIETSEHLEGLSVLTYLTVLVLSHNNIASIEHFTTFACNDLMLLDLSYNKIEELDIGNHFSEGLRSSLQDLRFVGNPCAPRYLTGCDGSSVSPKACPSSEDTVEDVAYIKTYRTVIHQACANLRSLDGARITNGIRRRLDIEMEKGESHIDDEYHNSEDDHGASCRNMDCEEMEQKDADDHMSPSLFLLKPSKRDVIAARFEGLAADMNPRLSSSSSSSSYIDECEDDDNDDVMGGSDDEPSKSAKIPNKKMKDNKRRKYRNKHTHHPYNVGINSSSLPFSHGTLLQEYLGCSSTVRDVGCEESERYKRDVACSNRDDGITPNASDPHSTEDPSHISLPSSIQYTKRKRRNELAKELVLAHQCRGAQARVLLEDNWEKAFNDVRKSRCDAMARKNERREEVSWAYSLKGADNFQKRVTTPNDINRFPDPPPDRDHSLAYLQALNILKGDAKCNNLSKFRNNE